MTHQTNQTRGRPRRWAPFVAIAVAVSFAATGLQAPGGAELAQAADPLPYLDQSLTFEARAADLVSRMTFEEKVAQHRSYSRRQDTDPSAPTYQAIPRLGVKAYRYWNEALHGVANVTGATSFPSALGIGATWNRDLVREMATAISDEARAGNNGEDGLGSGANDLTYWSPTINLNRDPRWGRADESYGEDPYLMGEIGKQFVSGLQTGDAKYTKIVSTPKHFFANNAENYRRNGDSVMSERDLREYYTPAFAALTGVAGSASRSMMTAYNRTNGTPMSASSEFIETMARRTWGFDGFITSDCDAILDEHIRHQWEAPILGRAITGPEATAWSIKAGTDLACDNGNWAQQYVGNLPAARDQGLITEEDMDVSLVRVFTERMRLGEWDAVSAVPYRGSEYRPSTQVGKASAAHTATANKMSDEAPVLLKNNPVAGTNDPALPLKQSDADSIVMLGYLSDEAELGGYSGSPNPAPISALTGLREAVAAYGLDPDASVTQINGITPEFGAKPGIESVTFHDAANAVTLTTAPPAEHRDGVWDWAGWRGIRYDPHYSNPSAMMPNQDWGGMFSLDLTLPAGTSQVSVQQLSCTGYTQATPGDDETPGTCNADSATVNPTAVSQVRIGGHLVVRLGTETGTVVGTVPADGLTSSNTVVPLTGVPTGTPVKLIFVYEPPAYTVGLTAAETAAVRSADAVVVRVGTRRGESSEEMDRYSIDLPRNQADLARLARQLNPKTVVWIESVGQMNIEPFRGEWSGLSGTAADGRDWTCGLAGQPVCSVPGIVWANYNGQAQGQSFARILFGKANPSGKLTFTWYSDILDIGNVNDYNLTPTATTKGRTYWYTNAQASYPFGWGLSYSAFDYSNLKVAQPRVTGDQTLEVSVDVTNTSGIVGKEVVQLYVTAPGADGVNRPKRQLKGFEKVALGPGQTKTVTIALPAADLWFWDEAADSKVWDLGAWVFRIGGSSVQGLGGVFTLTSAPSVSLGQVTAIPDGLVLNTATPGNVINAGLSAAKSDDSFFDLSEVSVVYTSSAPAVATVDGAGVVRAAGAGMATITAAVTYGGLTKSDSFPVVVYAGALNSEYSGTTTSLYGKLIAFGSRQVSRTAAAAGIDLGAAVTPASASAAYSYRIAPMDVNTAQATVTAAGRLTATRAGQVRVTVTVTDGAWTGTRSALIDVRLANAAALAAQVAAVEGSGIVAGANTTASHAALASALAAAKAVLANGDATQAQVDAALAALAAARAGLVARGDVSALGPLAAAAEALATSPGLGQAPAAALKAAAQAARALLADPGNASAAAVSAAVAKLVSAFSGLLGDTVAPPVVKVKAAQKAVTLVKGKSVKLVARAYTASGAAGVTWTSSKKSVATVTAGGKVKAKKAGTATLTVKAGTKTAKVALKVVAKKPAKSAVAKVSAKVPATLKVGNRVFVTGTYKPATATSVKVTYKSSKPGVVAVDAAGRLVAKAKGTAKITVKAGSKSKQYTVKVS